MSSWCWRTSDGMLHFGSNRSSIEQSLPCRNCAKLSPGSPRRGICCAIAIGSSPRTLWTKSRRWASKAMDIPDIFLHLARPPHHGYVERVIGTIRRERLDRVIVYNEQSPVVTYLRVLVDYYHRSRRTMWPSRSGRVSAGPHPTIKRRASLGFACFSTGWWSPRLYRRTQPPCAARTFAEARQDRVLASEEMRDLLLSIPRLCVGLCATSFAGEHGVGVRAGAADELPRG
jgi:hypothetical protein